MAASRLIEAEEADLEHGYKELSIPAGPQGDYRMAHNTLHIWPRGNFMLIALPNADGSFTATLFLPKRGAVSFEALTSPAAIEGFLRGQFSDAYELMPNCVAEFQAHPTGFLATVYADRWNARGMASLIGDAAHAILPFHGQGMNCCFEDCLEFDACLERETTWESVFEHFYASRKPNTDAIAAMALENYLEMRERVADPKFRLQQTRAGAGKTPSAALHSALLDGDVSPRNSLSHCAGSRQDPEPPTCRSHRCRGHAAGRRLRSSRAGNQP
jgi:kynurenine 3-monooxygenase